MENFHEDSSLYCSIEAAAPAVEGPLSWPFHHVLFTSSSYSGRCRSGLMLTVAAVRHRLFNNNVVLLQELGWVDSAISTPHAPRNATGLINPSGASALAWDFWSRPPLSVIPGSRVPPLGGAVESRFRLTVKHDPSRMGAFRHCKKRERGRHHPRCSDGAMNPTRGSGLTVIPARQS